MKFDKIVGFGDSWMYGDELLDPALASNFPDAHICWDQNTPYREQHCFLGLLAKHYDIPYENFGIMGGSLQSEIWTFLYWLEHEPYPERCMILVGHTDPDRMSWYNQNHRKYSNDPPWNSFIHTAWTHASDEVVPPDWKDLNKRFIAQVSSTGFDRLNWLQTIMLFDGVSARRKIPMLQFQVAPAPDWIDLPTLVWPNLDLCTYFYQHPENTHNRRGLWCKNGHPNERGHELIRDMLIPEIDRVIMSV